MEKVKQLYEGKAKKVYATENPELVIVSTGLKKVPLRVKASSTT